VTQIRERERERERESWKQNRNGNDSIVSRKIVTNVFIHTDRDRHTFRLTDGET
jgi:hypothetical protein